MMASLEAGEPIGKAAEDEAERLLLKATGGRVAKASSNGHSKGLGQLLRPNALARRLVEP